MKNYKNTILLIAVFALSVISSNAGVVYHCDFEDAEERAQWHLEPIIAPNHAPYLLNKWYIGSPGDFSPQKGNGNGLYISSDGGKSAIYDVAEDYSSYVFAWRTIYVPAGDYDLYFDWRAMGKISGVDAIHLYWVTDNSVELQSSVSLMQIETKYDIYKVRDTLSLSSAWQKAHYPIKQNKSDSVKLAFLWYCSAENLTPPSACIDNIEIYTQNNCVTPYEISHTIDSVIHLSWKGNADMYQVICYDAGQNTVDVIDSIPSWQHSVDIDNVSPGVRTFYVRGFCGNPDDGYEASDFEKHFAVAYDDDGSCIPYLDLNKATCYTSSYNMGYRFDIPVTKLEDLGSSNMNSRFTVHYDANEYDPRTGNRLKTVPTGNFASVRLGNWNVNKESERIEYRYVPQKGTSDILKIKYAVVMSSDFKADDHKPGHDSINQPMFNLEISYVDEKGNEIKYRPECFSVDFAAGYSKEDEKSYNVFYTSENHEINVVLWKDWDSLSISLSEFIGKETIVRLTTRDCTQGAHFGYAYYTLQCVGGALFGNTCSGFNTTFQAPADFDKYHWYRKYRPDEDLTQEFTKDGQPMIDGLHGDILNINDDDTCMYAVDVYFNEDKDCYYTLHVNGLPKIPRAKIDTNLIITQKNCQYNITFNNESYINIKDDRFRIDSIDAESKPNYFEWVFPDTTIVTSSVSKSVSHHYDTGGDYVVYLKAMLENCLDTMDIDTLKFHLDTLDNMAGYTTKYICEGQYYTYIDKEGRSHQLDTDTVIESHFPLSFGCDSIDYFTLIVLKKDFHDTITLCPSSLPYHVEGCSQDITGAGDYILNLKHKLGKESCDCDSIVELHVNIDAVEVETDNIVHNCVDGDYLEIPYRLISGSIDSICIQFTDQSPVAEQSYCFAHTIDESAVIQIPFISDVTPGRYPATLSFKSISVCPAAEKHIVVEISYSASVIGQKGYNGWIGLQNDERFVDAQFQWYRDGIALQGATQSYYPIEKDDYGHTFYVVVTRNGERDGISTCPVIFNGTTDLNQLAIDSSYCEVFTVLGEKIYEGNLTNCAHLHQSGLYIVRYPNTNEVQKISIR